MSLNVRPPLPPMEAKSVDEIPTGSDWQYEPKWDGFRCLVFKDRDSVYLQSKSSQPLARYFPELVETFVSLPLPYLVLDGEIAIPDGKAFSFDALLQRIHPAASRVKKLAAETPAIFVVFDLLADQGGKSLLHRPLAERRPELEETFDRYLKPVRIIRLSPATTSLATARKWLTSAGATLDGVIAKRRDLPYGNDERAAMQKIKNYRSADCVVGGFRYAAGKKSIASLLLGLYDDEGLLHHVGFTSAFSVEERKALVAKLEKAVGTPGFTGQAPGGPSRWNRGKSQEWVPLKPVFVVEVSYDHTTQDRFRHGTKILRWRPDKAPEQCTMDQLSQQKARPLKLLG